MQRGNYRIVHAYIAIPGYVNKLVNHYLGAINILRSHP